MSNIVFDPTYPEGYTSKYPLLEKDAGPYISGRSYNTNEVVKHLGSFFKSKFNGNTQVPATWDKDAGVVYFNTDSWTILINGTADYILHNEIKLESDEINRRITDINNNLQTQIDSVASSATDITIDINPDIVFAGVNNSVNIRSTLNTGGTVSSHQINRSGSVIASGTSTSISANDVVNANSDIVYDVTAVINGKQRNNSIKLKVVNKIYYGSGRNPSSADTAYDTPKETPQGIYNVNVRNNGDYVFIDIPNSMVINSATVNSFNIPFVVVTSSRSGYKCYKSTNTYDSGNIVIDVK